MASVPLRTGQRMTSVPKWFCSLSCSVTRRAPQLRPCLTSRFGDLRRLTTEAFTDFGVHEQTKAKPSLGPEIQRLKNIEEYLAFFQEHSEAVSAVDLCLLMEGLANRLSSAASDELGEEAAPSAYRRAATTAQKELFNAPVFMRMMNDVVRKLKLFGPGDLPRILESMHIMRWRDKTLLKIAEPMLVQHVPKVTIHDLPKVMQSYVSARCGGRVLYDALIHRILQAGDEFNSSELSALAQACSRSPHKPKMSLVGLEPFVVAKIGKFQPQEMVYLAQAYTQREKDRDRKDASPELTWEIATLLHKDNGALLKTLLPWQRIVMLQALALWSKHRPEQKRDYAKVFRLAAPLLLDDRAKLRPAEAATAVWSFTRLAVASPEGPVALLFDALHNDLIPNLERLEESSLAACLLAFAKLASGKLSGGCVTSGTLGKKHGTSEAESHRLPGAALVEAAEGAVLAAAANLPARELTSVILAYSLVRIGSAELFAVLQRASVAKSRDFPMEQASSVLWSFGTVRVGNAFFREVQIDVLERLNQLSVHAVCDILWSYCVVRHYDAHFFKTLLATLVPSRLADDARCALLAPAILDIRRHFPDMDPEGLDRYLGYVSEVFHQQQLQVTTPMMELESISEALDSLSLKHNLSANVDGYVVDALVAPASVEMQPVAILYHSARPAPAGTLHLKTGEPLGEAMMRQRYLRGSGYGVVNLWDEIWRDLELEERSALLLTKVSKAQASKPPESAGKSKAKTTAV